jgi:hypothetical protein
MGKFWTILATAVALVLIGLPAAPEAAGRVVLLEQAVNVGCG